MKSQLIFQLILIGTFLSPGQTCSTEKKGEVRSSSDDPEPYTGGPVTSSIGTNGPEHDTGEPDTTAIATNGPEPNTGEPDTTGIATNGFGDSGLSTAAPDNPGSGNGTLETNTKGFSPDEIDSTLNPTLGITPKRPNDEFSGNN